MSAARPRTSWTPGSWPCPWCSGGSACHPCPSWLCPCCFPGPGRLQPFLLELLGAVTGGPGELVGHDGERILERLGLGHRPRMLLVRLLAGGVLVHLFGGPAPVELGVLAPSASDPVVQLGEPVLVQLVEPLRLNLAKQRLLRLVQHAPNGVFHRRQPPVRVTLRPYSGANGTETGSPWRPRPLHHRFRNRPDQHHRRSHLGPEADSVRAALA